MPARRAVLPTRSVLQGPCVGIFQGSNQQPPRSTVCGTPRLPVMGIVFIVRYKVAKGEGMADGMWTMSEDGEFHLEEPYRTWLKEAKVESTRGWHNALVEYLEQRSPYTGPGAQRRAAEAQRVPGRRQDHGLRGVRARGAERGSVMQALLLATMQPSSQTTQGAS